VASIITKEITKELLQIPVATTTYDTLITTLIPKVQAMIIKYCRNSFLNINFRYGSNTIAFVAVDGVTPASITDSNAYFVTSDFVAGDYKIRWSKYNNKIVTVDTVAAGALTLASGETLVAEAAENSVMITKVEFPEEIQLPTAHLINYFMNTKGRQVKSESLPGGYSVTFKDDAEMMKPFNGWRKMYAD